MKVRCDEEVYRGGAMQLEANKQGVKRRREEEVYRGGYRGGV